MSPKTASILTLGALVLLIALVLGYASVYTIDETEQAIVVQFGAPVGAPVTEAGLHFKKPFIQDVRRFDKRVLAWDGEPEQINTRERQFLKIDTTARWRIVNPLTFLTSVRDESGAQSRLDDILDSVVRDAISSTDLVEIVRSADWEVSEEDIEELVAADEREETLTREVETGRERLVRRVLDEAQKQMPQYGIELVDVKLKRINYVEQVQREVFARMISERQRIATQFRSEGEQEATTIRGETEEEVSVIRSGAKREAEVIRGNADAEATRIYSEAYTADPEFYAFLRTLESYSQSLGAGAVLMLDTDSDYFRYLKRIEPDAAAPTPSAN